MQDLLLWRALGERKPIADEFVPLLEALASRPPAVRGPFAGRLIRAARDGRPRVRAAAIAALARHDGQEALRAVVRGLGDPEPAVGAVAVDTLRALGGTDPLRIAHAVFHPDPLIRRAAVTGGLPTGAAVLLPHLIGDEACVQDVLPLLADIKVLPGFVLPAALDMLAAGRLSPDATAALVRRIEPEAMLRKIAASGFKAAAMATGGGGPWAPGQLGILLESLSHETARPATPFTSLSDRLPELIGLFRSDAAGAPPAGRPLVTPLDAFVRMLPQMDEAVRRGVAVTTVSRLLAGATDDAVLVRLLVAAWPTAALWRWLDLHARRAAVDDFLAISAEQLAKHPYGILGDEWLVAIDGSDLLRPVAGEPPDGRVLACLARLVGLDALDRVVLHFPSEELVAALRQPRSAPCLTIPGRSDQRFRLVERVRGDERASWPRHLAHLVPTFNQELLPLLADFAPEEMLDLLSRLQRLDPPADIKDPRSRRLQGVADHLGRLLAGMPPPPVRCGVRIVSTGPRIGEIVMEAGMHVTDGPRTVPRPPETWGILLGDFVRQWQDGPRGPTDAFLRVVFLAAIDGLPEATATARLQSLDARSLRFLLFEQFAEDAIPSRIDATLRAALADEEREPAKLVASTLASAHGIVGGLNRVWTALLGGDSASAVDSAPSPTAVSADAPPDGTTIHTLPVLERCRLIDAGDDAFPRVVMPWSNRQTRGVAEALARRAGSQPRGIDAAAAILMCHDPLPLVDQALAAFVPLEARSISRLDSDLVTLRPGHQRLALPVHIWLWRWERHLDQALAILAETGRPLSAIVTVAHGMACTRLAVRFLEFVRAVLERCGFRDRAAFHAHATSELAGALMTALVGPAGVAAATALVVWRSRDPGSEILAHGRPRVIAMLSDLPRAVREVLEPWVSSRGLEDDDAAGATTTRDAFEACLSRAGRVDPDALERAVQCVVAESGPSWFMPADWERLVAAGIDERTLARRLAVARQPHAYSIALETLLTEPTSDADDLAAIEAFLEQGDTRLADLRIPAARLLLQHGNDVGLPLLLGDETGKEPRVRNLFAMLDADAVADAVQSALASKGIPEAVLAGLLLEPGVAVEARAAGLEKLLVEGTSDIVRDRILPHLKRSRAASERIHRVAECFAWGVRRGLELTGRLFAVEMIAGDDFGYTRLSENRVFVNPLPVLRGDRYGEEVVRGLVIHEVGHHVYHADEDNREATATARKEGIFSLLNLVQDEHLERNLRAIDPAMGDPLKRLAAYAFQHAPRQRPIVELLHVLDEQAFAVLTSVRLTVARKAGHVVVQAGSILRQLESRGASFPRFIRALRMGLGGRAADGPTLEALALFGPGFRHSSGSRLLEIARELLRIFSDEAKLLELFDDLEGPLSSTPENPVRAGEGVTNRELQREVERVLAPPRATGSSAGSSSPGGRRVLQINVSPDEEFTRISTVERVPFDPAKSAAYRRQVARPARQLRQFFDRLGFSHELQRQRLQGRFLDRGRLLALAIRGEPRVMVSRRIVPTTDLFLGVAVDCSGSMTDDDNIEKARLFAELLAESVRGCRGIDFRVCGFTHATIFDAGSAARCAAHNLEAGGGNNDAAGLWHLAGEALASRRRAKLLVMISDGLPTECSVAALRRVVLVLSQQYGMCCAQVAVRPLEEECFPIHVPLYEQDLGKAVATFGKTVVRLVQRAVRIGG